MNTPAHLIVGMAALGRPGHPRVTGAALAGAFLPDLSLYVMVAVSLYVLDIPAHTVFRELYFSDAWQQVFAIDNSFFLWGALLGVALWRKAPALTAFAGAGLLHLAFDFSLHNQDARMHFWPLSDWVFHSPLSYWDRRHYAGVIGPTELGMSLMLCAAMMWRFRLLRTRMMIVALGAAEFMASGIWRFIF